MNVDMIILTYQIAHADNNKFLLEIIKIYKTYLLKSLIQLFM